MAKTMSVVHNNGEGVVWDGDDDGSFLVVVGMSCHSASGGSLWYQHALSHCLAFIHVFTVINVLNTVLDIQESSRHPEVGR